MTHFVDMLKTRGARLAFGAAKDVFFESSEFSPDQAMTILGLSIGISIKIRHDQSEFRMSSNANKSKTQILFRSDGCIYLCAQKEIAALTVHATKYSILL